MRAVCLALACLALACAAAPADRAAALEGPRYQVTLHPVSGWTKLCGKGQAVRTTCETSRRFGTDTKKPPILALSIGRVEGDATQVVRVLMPGGLRVDRGLSFSVDGGARQTGAFRGCVPNGCLAEARFATPVLASMRRGGTLQIVTTDAGDRRVDFYLSLAGFAAAYDGPGVEARPVAPPRETPAPRPIPRTGGTSI